MSGFKTKFLLEISLNNKAKILPKEPNSPRDFSDAIGAYAQTSNAVMSGAKTNLSIQKYCELQGIHTPCTNNRQKFIQHTHIKKFQRVLSDLNCLRYRTFVLWLNNVLFCGV